MEDLLVGTRMKGVTDLFDFHSHNYNEMVLLHGGNCRFLVGNQFFHLQPGNLLMLDGNTIHKAYVYGDPDVYERSVLHFRDEWIQPLLKELDAEYLLTLFRENKNGLIRHFPKKEEAILERMIKEIAAIWGGPHGDAKPLDVARLKLLVAQLMIFVYQSKSTLTRKEETNRDEQTKLVERISNYLFSNYAKSITIDEISREVGLTKSYMSHLFKDVTGNTIMNYLMAYRLSQARNHLVVEPDLSIKQISLMSGFKSEAHFSRFFKQNLGMTPSEYRKNQIEFLSEGEKE